MDTNSSAVGRRIQEARLEAGLSQVRLARELGSTGRAVQFWEYGQRMPRMRTLTAIAEITGKPVSWFFEEVAA